MKARGCLTALVCAVVALLAPASGAAAAAKSAELDLSSFEVSGSNHYDVLVTTVSGAGFAPLAEVSAQRESVSAGYVVHTESAPGIEATFGSLGKLEVQFARRTKQVERPEPGCRVIAERGVFRGTFRFVGEGEYVVAEAKNPPGEVMRLPNGFCGFGGDRPARPSIPGLPAETVLAAATKIPERTVTFRASRPEFTRLVTFNASIEEYVAGMKITRTADIRTAGPAFTSTGRAKARVAPPNPFSGVGMFRDSPNGPAAWTGSLAVSLPGAPGAPLTGEGFTARLCPHQPFLRPCLPHRFS
ncbi:MAG TPA: hypothetical protein VFS64_08455 [Solirubrobacterales bacterium]|nr:hypothetical protein [Solirubrobacterales bacterium]